MPFCNLKLSFSDLNDRRHYAVLGEKSYLCISKINGGGLMEEKCGLQCNACDHIVCVKAGKVRRENLYEMTRKYWVMNLERAPRATHVCAVPARYINL